eukprot:1134885-Lingulodinium_polyedra.AAC.1
MGEPIEEEVVAVTKVICVCEVCRGLPAKGIPRFAPAFGGHQKETEVFKKASMSMPMFDGHKQCKKLENMLLVFLLQSRCQSWWQLAKATQSGRVTRTSSRPPPRT